MPYKNKLPRAPRQDSPSGDAAEPPSENLPMPAESETDKYDFAVPDSWTDEQETSLFKGMIRWKPVGMHKHFRIIAISENLRNHGYNGYGSPKYAHTRIPGIWEKLRSLYNIEALDIREDAIAEKCYPFTLPDEEYWDIKYAKRISTEGSASPPSLPQLLSGPSVGDRRAVRRHSTVEDRDDPRSSPASAHGKPGRGTRAAKGTTRTSHLAEVSTLREGHEGKDEPDRDDEDEGDDGDVMNEDEDGVKDVGKAQKAGTGKGSTRRSGRRR